MHKRKLTAKQMLLPCGDVMNWDSPIAKTQTNFSSLTMCDIPVFTTNYVFFACLLCVWYISEP